MVLPRGRANKCRWGSSSPAGYHSGKVSRQQGRHAPRRVRGSPPIPVSLPAQPWGCKGRSPLHKKTKKSPPSPEGKSALRARAGGWGQQSKLKAGLAGDKAGTPPAGYHSGRDSQCRKRFNAWNARAQAVNHHGFITKCSKAPAPQIPGAGRINKLCRYSKIPLDKAGDLLYNSRIFFNRKGDTAMFAAGMMMCMCRMMMCFCCEPNAGTSVCR